MGEVQVYLQAACLQHQCSISELILATLLRALIPLNAFMKIMIADFRDNGLSVIRNSTSQQFHTAG